MFDSVKERSVVVNERSCDTWHGSEVDFLIDHERYVLRE